MLPSIPSHKKTSLSSLSAPFQQRGQAQERLDPFKVLIDVENDIKKIEEHVRGVCKDPLRNSDSPKMSRAEQKVI